MLNWPYCFKLRRINLFSKNSPPWIKENWFTSTWKKTGNFSKSWQKVQEKMIVFIYLAVESNEKMKDFARERRRKIYNQNFFSWMFANFFSLYLFLKKTSKKAHFENNKETMLLRKNTLWFRESLFFLFSKCVIFSGYFFGYPKVFIFI